jgi:propionate CoA-transferase
MPLMLHGAWCELRLAAPSTRPALMRRRRRRRRYAPPAGGVRVALLRGTVADAAGNVSCEGEALLGDVLSQAAAAHNWGDASGGRGLVIVQVARLLPPGQLLPPGRVHIPGVLVDRLVLAPPAAHQQSFADAAADPSLCSSYELGAPSSPSPSSSSSQQHAMPLLRRLIAHRAMRAINRPNLLVNLGVGLPEGVAQMIASHGHQDQAARSAVLSTEAGLFGGTPQGGLRFGASRGHSAMVRAGAGG